MDEERIKRLTAWVGLATAVAGYLYLDTAMDGPISRMLGPRIDALRARYEKWRVQRRIDKAVETEAQDMHIAAEIIKRGPA